MNFKRPESVLVVIYTSAYDVLLIQRSTPPLGWWQSVTGSLLWHETPLQAAIREVKEETGLEASSGLRNTGVVNRFEIVAENRHLYAPAIRINREYVFNLELPARADVTLDKTEHSAAVWLPAGQAAGKTASLTNREAILRLIGR